MKVIEMDNLESLFEVKKEDLLDEFQEAYTRGFRVNKTHQRAMGPPKEVQAVIQYETTPETVSLQPTDDEDLYGATTATVVFLLHRELIDPIFALFPSVELRRIRLIAEKGDEDEEHADGILISLPDGRVILVLGGDRLTTRCKVCGGWITWHWQAVKDVCQPCEELLEIIQKFG